MSGLRSVTKLLASVKFKQRLKTKLAEREGELKTNIPHKQEETFSFNYCRFSIIRFKNNKRKTLDV